MDIRKRKTDFLLAIIDIAQENIDQPFIFGERDCHTITLGILDKVFDANGLRLAYKKYKTPKGAMRYQKKLGIDIKGFIARYAEPVAIEMLAPTDVVLSINEAYGIYNVYWYLGNSRFLIADETDELVRAEYHPLSNFKSDYGFECYRFTDDALNMLIAPWQEQTEQTDANTDNNENTQEE